VQTKHLFISMFLLSSCVDLSTLTPSTSSGNSSNSLNSSSGSNETTTNTGGSDSSSSTPSVPEDKSSTPTSGTDPLLSFQWHLNNTGQNSFSSGSGSSGNDINFDLDASKDGSGIIVAVSDDAVQVSHEDLSDNAVSSLHRNYHQSGPVFSGDPSPGSGDTAHGTAVAGIILASSDNGIGGRGVAPSAQLAGFRFLNSLQSTEKFIDQANGPIDVFNYSYGASTCVFAEYPSSYIAQLEFGVNFLRSGKGAIYVKSAGNDFISPLTACYSSAPSNFAFLGNANLENVNSFPFSIIVGAFNATGVASSYSTPGSSVWVSAPGGEFGKDNPAIVTTDLEGCDVGNSVSSATANDFEKGNQLNSNCNYTSTMNGTSSAAPMVSGVVALMLKENPSLTWRDVKYILAKTATHIDSSRAATTHPLGADLSGHTYQDGWVTNSASFNFHNWYGFGSVNADAAISMASTYSSDWGVMTKISETNPALSLSIPDNLSSGVENTIDISSELEIEAVQIVVDIDHELVGDLGIELTSPSGTKSQLMLINSGLVQTDINNGVLLSNAFYMEEAKGEWKIKVIDGATGDTGTLNSWTLNIYGH
jgi:subtilisin family serine protease